MHKKGLSVTFCAFFPGICFILSIKRAILSRNSQQAVYQSLRFVKRPLPALLSAVCIFLAACTPTESVVRAVLLPAHKICRMSQDFLGIPLDGYEVLAREVARNESLSELLAGLSLPSETVSAALNECSKVLDLRKIRAGQPYTLLCTEGGCTDYLIYKKSEREHLVFDLREPEAVEVKAVQKTIQVREREASGRIQSSLYATIYQHNLHPALAEELEKVFAWSVDFFRLQKGDAFKVIYREEFAEGESLGVREIVAAEFKHGNETICAYGFEQDGIKDFFDSSGASLRKAFLKAPLRYARISSGYSKSRLHPILGYHRPHLGVDYAAPHGTPIYAIGDGVVEEAAVKGGNGRYLKLRHNHSFQSQYLHLSGFAPGIRAGQRVKQGDVIGYVGSTGLATGPHLCFRLWKDGAQVNPLTAQTPPAYPVKPERREAFEQAKAQLSQRLSRIS